MQPATCARCGAPFQCGLDDPQGCWCAKLPALPRAALDASAGCLCEACLRRLQAAPRGSGPAAEGDAAS